MGVKKFKHLDNLPNGWTDWHHIWYTPADSSGNGHGLNTISPSIPQGAFGGGGVIGGQKFKSLEIYQTAGPIGPQFGKRLRIHLGMDIG